MGKYTFGIWALLGSRTIDFGPLSNKVHQVLLHILVNAGALNSDYWFVVLLRVQHMDVVIRIKSEVDRVMYCSSY